MIGRTRFNEIARGQISDIRDGLLKMVADPTGEYLLGVQIIGEGATELIHLGHMALQHGATVDSFVENIFNFPTLAETNRVAALDIVGQPPTASQLNRRLNFGTELAPADSQPWSLTSHATTSSNISSSPAT